MSHWATLSSVPQSHPFICFTGPPLGLFQTAPYRLRYRAALLFVSLIIPFVYFTKPLFPLSAESPHFYKEHLLFVSQQPFCLFLSQTYLFVCCTNLFRYCTDQRICLHLRFTLLSVSQRNLSLPKSQSRFHCCQPFVAKMTWVTYSLSLIWYFELKPAFTKESRIKT